MKKILLLSGVLFFSCENVLINEEISTSQTAVFNQIWNDFDQHYAGFTVRTMDWDSVNLSMTSAIRDGLSQEDFKNQITRLLLSFQDIHVALITSPANRFTFDPTNPTSVNGIASLDSYVDFRSENQLFQWGTVKDTNIGYIHIKTFSERFFEQFSDIDRILNQLSSSESLIIDVRNNGGGAPASAYRVASRFISSEVIASKTRFRNGSEHENFDEPIIGKVSPQGQTQYTRPVVIIMNKSTRSAAELFVLPLRLQDNVQTIGDNTAGGLGLNNYRELSNGWNYRLTTTLTSDANDQIFEGDGISPDRTIFISKNDSINGVDLQLEEAVKLLN